MTQRVALVTGASRGIGAACALALGEQGFKVAVHYRSGQEQAEAIAAKIPGAMPVQADLGDPAACEALVEKVTAEMGSLDVLVNNAGMCIDELLLRASLEDFDKLLDVNLKSILLLSKLVVRGMMRQRYGRIINLTSVVGFSGNAGQSMYCATKAAIVGFTKSIALELGSKNVLCNCVAPGFIDTDMTSSLPASAKDAILSKVPLKKLGEPQDIADAVAFLASDRAKYITGSTIHVNGGMFTN